MTLIIRSGHSQTVEAEILTQVTRSLEQALPQTWSIAIEVESPRLQRGRSQSEPRLTVTPPDSPPVTLAIETRRLDRGTVAEAISQATATSEATRRPTIIATDYANPALRAACTQAGIGFVDATGWIRLQSDRPALFVAAQGASRPPRTPRNAAITRLYGSGAGRMIRTLLATTPPVGVRELAGLAGVSPGSAAKLLPTLVLAGALERDPKGAVVHVRRHLLLTRWTQDYTFTKSNREVAWFASPQGDDARSRLAASGTAFATGAIAVRAALTLDTRPTEPVTLAAYYTRDPKAAARSAGLLEATPKTADVVLARPRDELLLSPVGDCDAVEMPAVPLAQALADLLTLPRQCPNEKELVLKVLTQTDPDWAH